MKAVLGLRGRMATLAACVGALPARAESPRDFNADTPGKVYSPYTVAESYLQLESDAFHIVEMGDLETIQTLDPVLKYGVFDNIDLELQTGGLLHASVTTNGHTHDSTGYGDTTPILKWNVFGNDGQDFSAAVRLSVKLPTASPGFGNGQVEYSVTFPTQLSLPHGLTLQLQQEIDLLKNQNDDGKHFSYSEDLSLGRSFGAFTVSVEAFAQSGTDHGNPALYTADLGLSYATTSVSVVTLGAYMGLNKVAPPIEAFLGVAFRF